MSEPLLPHIQQIDALIQVEPPSDFNGVVTLLEQPVLDKYLFTHLQRSDWLAPLDAAGLLNRDELKRHPYRLSYVLHLAQRFPQNAAEILKYADLSDPESQLYFIEILKRLPEDLFLSLLPEMERWHENEPGSNFNYRIEEFVEWSLNHTTSATIQQYLLRYLLTPTVRSENSYNPFTAVVDETQFPYFLEAHRKQLQKSSWYTPLLIDLLGEYAAIRARKPYSMHDPNGSHHLGQRPYPSQNSIDETLVAELLRILPTLSPGKLKVFWAQLSKYPYAIFRRIRLLALAAHPDPSRRALSQTLLDRYAFEHFPEYRDTARAHFPKLSDGQQEIIWSWVREDTNLLGRLSTYPEEQRREHLDYALWTRLLRIQPHLPHDLRGHWETLSAQFGEEERVGFNMVVRDGIPSSVTPADLANQSIPDLVRYLQLPPPPTGDDALDSEDHRYSGLMRVLRQDVQRRPAEYLAHLDDLLALPPQALSTIISALRSTNDLAEVPVQALVRLLHFANQRSQATRDHTWSWNVGWIADLFEDKVLKNETVRQNIQFAPDILNALLEGLNDPEPAAGEEQERLLDGDAFTASLNTTRGKVVHALLRWMGWVSEVEDPQAKDLVEAGKRAIRQHLQPENEQAPSVYAAVVPALPWFHYIDPTFAGVLIPRLFDRDRPAISRPVWRAFLNGTSVYSGLFELMRPLYVSYASEDLPNPTAAIWSTRESVQRDFGQHIGMLFVLGRIGFDDSDQLMAGYLNAGKPKAIAEVVAYLVRSLNNTDGDTSQYASRIESLWAGIVLASRMRSDEEAQVMRASFLPLINSDRFDIEWRTEQLEAVIRLGLPTSALQQVVFKVVKLPASHLVRILKLLQLLASFELEHGLVYQSLQLLENVEDHRSSIIDEEVNKLVHLMINAGYVDAFRKFLR